MIKNKLPSWEGYCFLPLMLLGDIDPGRWYEALFAPLNLSDLCDLPAFAEGFLTTGFIAYNS